MKKLRILTLLSCLILFPKYYFSQNKADETLINNGWKFHLGDINGAEKSLFEDKNWKNIDLPHDWSIKENLSPTLSSATGYLPGGIGWYRKTINIPSTQKGKKVFIYFEGVYNRSQVYINGKLLGKRPNGYISFQYDATDYIDFGKENVIAVRVDHSKDADSRWYTGSGIYRNVWLLFKDPVRIAQWGVYAYPTNVNTQKADLNYEIEVENEPAENTTVTIVNELFESNGKSVIKKSEKLKITGNSNNKLSGHFKITKPKLWSIENPNLYTLKTTILQNNKIVDEKTITTGFRDFTFDADKGFSLNGKNMKIKGVCLHHDAGVLGAAMYRDVWKRRLKNLKELGVNAIRTSHNPQAPDLYFLCDELGLLVLNEAYDEWEFPKRKWIEGWNVGTPKFDGNFDFFEEWGEKDLADMVKRDRNHVSVFAWSIGNEVDYPNDPYSHPILAGNGKDGSGGFTQPIFGGYKKEAPDAQRLGVISKKLVAVVKKYDLSRPVTAGLAGVAMSNETEYPGSLDIAGYNYTESKYASDHKKYPKRVIFGSENRHELSAWKAVTDNDFIFGQFLWTGIDYLGESGSWPSRGFYSGLLDFGGFIKPRGYFRQALWLDKPVVYLGTYPTPGKNKSIANADVWSQLDAKNEGDYTEKTPSMDAWPVWNYNEGESIRVVSYTNCEQAKLLLNGKQIGETKNYDNNTGIIYWDIPYSEGKLEVIGLNKGQESVSYKVQTSGRPYKIIANIEDDNNDKDSELMQITVNVVDENGLPVILADNEITCDILGSAKLLGLEGSDNADMGDYNDNRQRVYKGRLLAYIKKLEGKEKIKVYFSSPLLKSAVVELNP